MSEMSERLEAVEKNGVLAKGKKEIIKHLNGERLSFKQAIIAKCYDCMGYCEDGKEDCKVPMCSLYPFMPYNPNKAKKKIVSEENRKAFRDRMESARLSRSGL